MPELVSTRWKRCAGRALLIAAAWLAMPEAARAQDRLCDPSFENCRTPLLDLIRHERVGIDAAWWFMTDARYTAELIRKWREGVPVRVIIDPRANTSTPLNAHRLQELRDAGIPMRRKVSSGILHWKMMLFAGQQTVQFGAANYSSQAFVATDPYRNYTDEVIYFSTLPSVVQSFMTRFDDLWTNTSGYANHANISGPLARRYPRVPKDPELNFPPSESFRSRSQTAYRNERHQIDAVMFRITDRAHADALIDALGRGVRVRLITDWGQYTSSDRLWHAWNVDRLYKAGAHIRVAGESKGRPHSAPRMGHWGTMHQKTTLLHSQGMTIVGSSNWTSPSTESQEEHNYFTTRPTFFQYFHHQFERKWNNSNPLGATETEPFVPLPPDVPALGAPVHAATDLSPESVTLRWMSGSWTHVYDVYFGTDPNPPLAFAGRELGPSQHGSDYKSLTVRDLLPTTTYYWRVVGRTMADLARSSEVRAFTTGTAQSGSGGSAPPFGRLDTPAQGATGVAGSIPVTGWALDDVGVTAIRIFRDPVAGEAPGLVFVGHALPVRGSRPDVAAEFPSYPNRTSAGWGYLLLTNMLPNQGNGVFTLHAYADDAHGNSTRLGSRTITCANSASTAPFGAIDTPGQGQTVSGMVHNFGWVLTPGAARGDVPGGGTVHVFIDGVPVGVPSGWTGRADLSALFPSGFSSLASAAAVFTIDTRGLGDGVHTIAWGVRATNGQTAGIGSRYFTVANGAAQAAAMSDTARASGADPSAPAGLHVTDLSSAVAARSVLSARLGFDPDAPYRPYRPDAAGLTTIQSEELDRIELRLGEGGGWFGYLRAGRDLWPLPIGAHLDASTGSFTWQPGVAFAGPYDFTFVRHADGALFRTDVRIILRPKASGLTGPQVVIDTPPVSEEVAQPFLLGGWAADLDDEATSGVETVHVWAYPLTGGAPIFLGVADYGGARPDVAVVHGARFEASGYELLVHGLPPGHYDLAVFAWSTPAGGFVPARVLRVHVR